MSSASPHQPATHFQATAVILAPIFALALSQCSAPPKAEVVVSVKDQQMGLYSEGKLRKQYPISTSKFGLGDELNSYRTPLGKHEVIAKIGHGLPTGAVLKSRHWNGEVLKPNAPGRDPIVSRILWLRGLERENRNAMKRYIYIHGTTEENRLGSPASYGCIRMGMKDVVDAFNEVGIGAKVVITKGPLPNARSLARATVPEVRPENPAKTESDRTAPAEPTAPEPLSLEPAPVLAVSPDQGKPPLVAEPVELKRSFIKGLFGGKKNIVVSETSKAEPSATQPSLNTGAPSSEVPEATAAPQPSMLKRLLFGKSASPEAKPEPSAKPKEENAAPQVAEATVDRPSFIKRLFFGSTAEAPPPTLAIETEKPVAPTKTAKPASEETVGPTAESEQVARGKAKKDQAVRTSKAHPEVA